MEKKKARKSRWALTALPFFSVETISCVLIKIHSRVIIGYKIHKVQNLYNGKAVPPPSLDSVSQFSCLAVSDPLRPHICRLGSFASSPCPKRGVRWLDVLKGPCSQVLSADLLPRIYQKSVLLPLGTCC